MTDPVQTIRRVESAYFELLESYFADERKAFAERTITSYKDVATFVSDTFVPQFDSDLTIAYAGAEYARPIQYKLHELLTNVLAFWKANSADLFGAARECDGLLSVFAHANWGEMPDQIRSYGLYFDTVCVTDHVHLAAFQYQHGTDGRAGELSGNVLFYVLLQYFTILKHKSLFVADSNYPIAVLFPAAPGWIPANDPVTPAAEMVATAFANDVFAKTYQSFEEAFQSFAEIPFDEAFAQLSHGPLKDIARGIEHAMTGTYEEAPALGDKLRLGLEFSRLSAGGTYLENPRNAQSLLVLAIRYSQFALIRRDACASLGGDPSLDRLEWGFFLWELAKQSRQAADLAGLGEALAVVRAFEKEELRWLQAVSEEELIQLREHGELEHMRELFRVNRKLLKTASLDDFDSVADAVRVQVEDALAEHAREIEAVAARQVTKRWKSGTSAIIGAAIGIGSIAMPPLAAAITAVGSTIFGAKSLKDLVSEERAGKKELRDLQARPVGILFQVRQRSLAPRSFIA